MILDEDIKKVKEVLMKVAKEYLNGNVNELVDLINGILTQLSPDERKMLIQFYIRLKKDKFLF